jgi:phage terminase small subunit
MTNPMSNTAQLKKLRSKLNAKQIRFCQELAKGNVSLQEAAKRAGYAESCAHVTANRHINNAKVKAYLDALQKPIEKEATLTRQRKRELLKAISEDWTRDKGAAVQAIKTDNSMTGDDAPVRIEGEITLNHILNSLQATTGLPSEEEDYD